MCENIFTDEFSYLMIAGIAQLGECQTEDLKVMCSIHVHRTCFTLHNLTILSKISDYLFFKHNELAEIPLLMNFHF